MRPAHSEFKLGKDWEPDATMGKDKEHNFFSKSVAMAVEGSVDQPKP